MKKYVLIICLVLILTSTLAFTLKNKTYEIGDVDKNGKIDIDDIMLLLKYIDGEADIKDKDLYLLDFNGDGEINKQDAKDLLNYIYRSQ